MFDALLAFFHYAAIFLTLTFLTVGMTLCRAPIGAATAVRLSRIDMFYFIAAMLVLLSGLARIFYGAKGSAFYLHNQMFYAKVGVFVLVGLLSLVPTIRFMRWAKAAKANVAYSVPAAEIASVRRFIHAELFLLLLLPLLAAFMARGIGA